MNRDDKLVLWGNYFGFVVMGMIVVSFGATMPFIRDSFNLDYEQGGAMLALFSASYLVNGFLGGTLSDRFGIQKTIVLGNLLYVMGLLTMAFTPYAMGLFIGVVITGMGWGFCNTGINVRVALETNGDGNAMSLLHMSYGIGAFIVPLVFSGFTKWGLTWQHTLVFLGGLATISLILSIKMKAPLRIEKKKQKNKPIQRRRFIVILTVALILFFYVGSENSFSNWLVTYLIDELEFSESFSQNVLSTLWLTVIVSRFFVGRISRFIKPSKLIFIMGLGGIIGLATFNAAGAPVTIVGAVVIIGLMFAGIYPMTMTAAQPSIAGSATISAIIISGGGLGSTILPYVTGILADRYGTPIIFTTVWITIAAMSVFAGLHYLLVKNQDA